MMDPDGNHSAAYGRGVRGKIKGWQGKTDESKATVQPSSSSSNYHGMLKMQNISGHDDSYGKPVAGSKTELRGKQAGVRISKEVVELCEIIKTLGSPQNNGTFVITFGVLFEFYTRISNKMVGMLLRARKQDLITFEGEMLFQRRDDDVVITLLRDPDELQKDIDQRKSELAHHEAVTKK